MFAWACMYGMLDTKDGELSLDNKGGRERGNIYRYLFVLMWILAYDPVFLLITSHKLIIFPTPLVDVIM